LEDVCRKIRLKCGNFLVFGGYIGGVDAAVATELENIEGVIKGPHYYLLKRYPLEKLEREVYELPMERGSMPLSTIWRSFHCHL